MSVAVLDAQDATGRSPDQTAASVWFWRTFAVIAAVLVFRLIYVWLVPLDLVIDEAYYWDWSRRPDIGYFSKPPMVAWLIAASTALGGSTPFFVRFPAVLLSSGGLWFAYLLGARMYGPKVGFWATLLSLATPGSAALGLLMTIDAPLLFCWCATLYCFWRYLEQGRGRLGWLALATLTAGLGVLSKQTMLGFLPLTGLFLLTAAQDRRRLVRPGVWLFLLGTLLFLLPVFAWNAQHDWITAQHTQGHFHADSVSLGRRIVRSAEYIGGQFGVVSPVTAGLLVALAVAAARSIGRWDRRERYLVCFSLFPLLGVLALSFLQRVQPNWPAAFYPAGIILLSAWGHRCTHGIVSTWAHPKHLRRALAVGVVSMLLTYLVPWAPGLQGSRLDPAVRLRGWRELGTAVGERFDRLPHPEQTLLVVATGRSAGSELAFYMPQQPRVYVWNGSGETLSQYDIWGGPTGRISWDALILTAPDGEPPVALARAFDAVHPLGKVTVPIGNGRAHEYRLWRAESLAYWPNPAAERLLHIASPKSDISQDIRR